MISDFIDSLSCNLNSLDLDSGLQSLCIFEHEKNKQKTTSLSCDFFLSGKPKGSFYVPSF